MLATAQFIHQSLQNCFPNSYNELIKLKGIGPYTAAAIASISFGEKRAVVDGNVMRVIARYHGLKEKVGPSLQKITQGIVDKLIPEEQPGDFNQAIMELGATVCKPQQALCNECPIVNKCEGHKLGIQNQIPLPKDRTKIKKRYFNFLLFLNDNKECIIERRKGQDIWEGLYQFPLVETSKQNSIDSLINKVSFEEKIKAYDSYAILGQSKVVKHILSHQHIFAKIILIKSTTILPSEEQEKISVDLIDQYATPKLIEKLMQDAKVQDYIR
jgi:A/G-specific adenine glycosylase